MKYTALPGSNLSALRIPVRNKPTNKKISSCSKYLEEEHRAGWLRTVGSSWYFALKHRASNMLTTEQKAKSQF